MAKRKRMFSAGLLAVGLTGFVTASQWGHAAEPPAYPVAAAPEMMQLLRDEHDLVAEMISGAARCGTRPIQGTENGHQHGVGAAAGRSRSLLSTPPPKHLMRVPDDARNNNHAAFPRHPPALPSLPELRPRPALCADRSGNGRSRGTSDLQLPGLQPLGHRISRRASLVE